MDINVENGDGWTSVVQDTPDNYFAATWSGSVQVTINGSYSFSVQAGYDGGSILYVDGSVVVNVEPLFRRFLPFQTVNGVVNLNAGQHSVLVSFFQNEDYSGISVWWNGPDTGTTWALLQS